MRERFFTPESIYCFLEGDDPNPPGGDSAKVVTLQQRLDAANGSAMVVAQQLLNELFTLRTNFNAREQNLTAFSQEIADLKKQIPPEGARVLTKEEATTYDALLALGKPEEIKMKLEKAGELETRLAEHDRDALLRSVAEVEGWKFSVLKSLDKQAQAEGVELSFLSKEETVNGKTNKYYEIKAGDKTVKAQEYATSTWADFTDSLKAEPVPKGKQFVHQDPPGHKPGPVDVYERIRARKKAEQEEKQKGTKPIHERLHLSRPA